MKRPAKRTAQKITPFLWFDDRAQEAVKFCMLNMAKLDIQKLKQMARGEWRNQGSR